MEFEAQITSFSTGIILFASYIISFDFQNYAYYFLFSGTVFLVLVAFKGYKIRLSIGVHQIFAVLLAVIFLLFPPNSQLVPLVVILITCLISFRAKPAVFLPSLLGLLSLLFLQSANVGFLSKTLGIISTDFSQLLGIESSVDNAGYIHKYFSSVSSPILVDEVKMLLPLYLSILIGYVVLLFLLTINKKKVLQHTVVSILLTFLMPIVTLTYITILPNTMLFVPNTWLALLFPFAYVFLLSAILPNVNIASEVSFPSIFSRIKARILQKIRRMPGKIAKNATHVLKIATIVLLAIFSILSLLNSTPLQTRNAPTVIIDESHSEWEPTWTNYAETYEKDPNSGTNNYFGLLNFLSSVYDCTLIVDRVEKKPAVDSVRSVLAKEITLQALENIVGSRKGVLILKCVTRPYTKSETDAILEFAARGNGLILISDHTDLWGMSTNLNPIAEQLGCRFLPSAVEDVFSETRGTVTHKSEFPIFISRFLTGDFYWATGCSLEKLPS